MSGSNNNNNNNDDAQSAALMELLAPDGYYAYLRINKSLLNATTAASTARSVPNDHASKNQHESSSSMHSSSSSSSTAGAAATTADDEQQQEFDNIKKNYRKLSLKHHPDRGGDANTFRLLNRAQRVLSNPKLRKQYDILGIDLDDDDDNEHRNDDGGEGTPAAGAASSGSSSNAGGASGDDRETTAQGIVHEIASMVLTSIIQLGVRTMMLGAVSLILVRYRWTFYPCLLFLSTIALKIAGRANLYLFLRGGSRSSGAAAAAAAGSGGSVYEVASPLLIALGLILMHTGRNVVNSSTSTTSAIPIVESGAAATAAAVAVTATSEWTYVFWMGEALVIAMFTYNSIPNIPASIPTVVWAGSLAFGSSLLALWFRGKFWNYFWTILFIVFLGVFVALAFPVMELLLEAILNEKLTRVGEKIRAQHRHMEAYYAEKLKGLEQQKQKQQRR